MGKDALVILGAGASHGLMAEQEEKENANSAFRPPLTDGIFSHQSSFQQILQNYPDASALAETIRAQAQDQTLEQLLRDFSQSGQEHRRRQFREVPLYLQELFGFISETYLMGAGARRQPPNYAHLVNELLSYYRKVAFVTLNYDTFLEQVLEVPSLAGPVAGLDWYVRHDNWLLVKLHGSVNWGRRILNYPEPRVTSWDLRAIGETEIEGNLDDEIIILPTPGYRTRWINEDPYYPALVVPLGTYEFSCPDSHVEALRAFLPSCTEVLVIGISAKDADLLELLAGVLPRTLNFSLVDKVDKDFDHLSETNSKLVAAVPQLGQALFFDSFDDGFTGFVQARGVEKFATRVR